MSIERIRVLGWLACLLLAANRASGQDFNERFAAWSGRAPAPPRAAAHTRLVTQTSPDPEVGGESEALPTPTGRASGSQPVLADAYSAPMHTPNYNQPWTSSPCASCSHNPTFEPGSDPLGTCQYGGGHSWFGNGGDCCGGGSCGPCGNSPCGQCGGAGGGCDFSPWNCNTMVWARFDALMWWRQGRDFPSLVTTDPTTESSTTAGVLPDAQTLFGNGRVASTMQAGGRLDIGFFTDPRQCFGVGNRFFGVGKDSTTTNFASNNIPVLAIPFTDFATGNNDALLVAYPGLRTGTIGISTGSTILGNDVYFKFLLCQDCNHRIDFITGWNYTRVNDDFQMTSRSTVTETGGTIPTGTVTTITDQFTARNNFNGGILGLQWQRNCGVWSSQMLLRTSLGSMRETMIINGSTNVAAPNQTPQTTAGGLFTANSNLGRHSQNEFTAISEFGFNLAYRFAPCTQLTVGYTLMYWNDILSATKSINTSVGTNTAANVTQPQFAFTHSDFWVQGINLGITREF